MCALAVLAMWLPTARGDIGTGGGLSLLDDDASFIARSTNSTTNYLDDFTSPAAWLSEPASPESESVRPPMESAAWDDGTQLPEPVTDFTQSDSHPSDREELDEFVADDWSPGAWSWQWMPAGLIYRSYLAGVHEPRMALVAFYESGDRTLWDATLGGRVGLLRCGDCDPLFPQGYQLDFYGAAVARLDVEHHQDLDSTDYVFGFPVTYGVGNWQFKLSYAHLSSHLGDELALRDPDTLDERVNYVRDAIVFGTSCYPHPVWRQYAEVGWAFHNSGGAQPWDAQFGSELSQPGPTGPGGSPFLAVNGRMREEHDFGGDLSVQAGWLRRGEFGQTLRFGAHYYNGKSSQFQFYDNFEEQMGIGLWYDF